MWHVFMQIDPVEITEEVNGSVGVAIDEVQEGIRSTTIEINTTTKELLDKAPETIIKEVTEQLEQNGTETEALQ